MYLVLAYVFGMYSLRRQSISDIIYTVFIVSIALTICIMAACFFIRESAASYPRSVILLSSVLYFFGLIFWRALLRKYYYSTHRNRKAMIVGSNTEKITGLFQSKFPGLYKVEYICTGNESDIENKALEVEDIFITDEVPEDIREKLFLLSIEQPRLSVSFLPKLNDIGIINARLQKLDDMPMHAYSRMFLTEEERFVKRIIDIAISLLLLLCFAPLFIVLPFLIILDGGHVFYRQERLTRGHKAFRMIKFRTMIPDAEQHTGPVLSDKNDQRITRIGKFLRATRFDELPQLFNILAGDMSLVGPRPERPYFTEKIEQAIPEFKYRLNVKAGLTGLAQVMSRYNTDVRQKLQYDIYYINNYSVFRDILILLQTVKILFIKDYASGVENDTEQ
jgi:exopolysaccharide biosynthesis polyprenyl glycosylphosphotransferase